MQIWICKVLQIILAKGADVTLSGLYDDGTPLEIATTTGRRDILGIIIKKLGSAFKQNQGKSLFIACHRGFTLLASDLLQAGADPNLVNEEYGRSCLLEATRLKFSEIVALLLTYGANSNTYDDTNNTPLFWAANHNDEQMVERLVLSHVDQKNKLGESARSIAEKHGLELKIICKRKAIETPRDVVVDDSMMTHSQDSISI